MVTKNQQSELQAGKGTRTVIVTGGGSGGHLFPLQTVCRELRQRGCHLIYLGRNHPLEKQVMGDEVDEFITIPVGKLRRNWSVKVFFLNALDLVMILAGFVKSFFSVWKIKNKIKKNNSYVAIFSSGGFVSVPPVISSYLCRIPIVIHEQTARAGLANRITAVMADKICLSFPDSAQFFPDAKKGKTVYTGFPLREEFYSPRPMKQLMTAADEADFFGFRSGQKGQKGKTKGNSSSVLKQLLAGRKPLILITGGSNGSKLINEWVTGSLPALLKKYTVCHQTGARWLDHHRFSHPGYFPVGFISQSIWPLLLKRADVLVGRSGAGTVHECVHLKRKAVFVPLAIAQKDEQYHNALFASRHIPAVIVKESEVGSTHLPDLIADLLKKKPVKPKTKEGERMKKKPVEQLAGIIIGLGE